MITCKVCGQPNDPHAAACSRCNSRLTIAPRQCPNGHILEPGATECVYCRNETQAVPAVGSPPARQRTEIVSGSYPAQQGAPPVYAARPASPPPSGGRRTEVAPTPAPPPVAGRPETPPPPPAAPRAERPATPPPAAPRADRPPAPASSPAPASPPPRKTEFYSSGDGAPSAPARMPAAAVSAAPGRKIVAVLVTYSWRPEGQIFPVYEGRNMIGRGEDCEICVPNDSSLSERNSHISYQQRFVVGDLVSMSGTFLNGNAVLSQFEPLPDTATLRTGSTTWLFVSLLQYGGGPS